ncbi:MAG TPA: glutamate--tRNA ligase, partial [Rhodobacteraceae bacterium]|nr:glutamate--tRNA ligase [Paracoccaceae bacterium]
PTKFDEADLLPLTARYLAGLGYDAVAPQIRALGVPDDLAPEFWQVLRENITVLGDLEDWWTLIRDGAEPVIAEEDAGFVAQALDLLPPPPYGPDSWRDWTNAVKAATGRKGRGLFMPLRRALTGQDHGPDMGRLMPLLQVVRAKG